MFRRVLFPTDFSVYANAVLACLPELQAAGTQEVVLLGALAPDNVPLGPAFLPETLDKLQWSAEEALNIDRMALEGQGLRVKVRLEQGNAAAEIGRVAHEEAVDLITLGAQGRTLAQEILLGSVAQEVLRLASVPVLIQKFQVVHELGHTRCERVCEQMFTRVLHPTDFSACADEAFRLVKNLKSARTEEVLVLHVHDEREMQDHGVAQMTELDRDHLAKLESRCRALRLFGMRAPPRLRRGVPFRETLQVADEEEVSLIVLGSPGRGAWQELLRGSIFENVVRLSRQPVLVVHAVSAA